MRYRSSNLAEPKARMRLFAARKVHRLLLAFASVLQAASATEQYSLTEDKIDGPPILLGRVERGRRDAGRLSTPTFVCKLLLAKITTSGCAKRKSCKEMRKGVGCRSPRAAMPLPDHLQ